MKKTLNTPSDPIASASPAIPDLLDALEEKEQLIAQRDALIAEKNALIDQQQKQLELLEEALRLARQQRFGSSSEKSPFQGDLFDEAELAVSVEEVEAQLPVALLPKHSRKPKKRDGFADKLPRIRIEFPLSEEEKAGAIKTFFAKVKEELDIVPAKAQVIEYWQEKAVFDQEDGAQQLRVAQRPTHPLGKCMASVQLLAWVLVSKYADALPLYRQEGILKRYGGQVSRTTMANWVIRLESVFNPLIERLRYHQLTADYLQADETRIQVLKETGKVATSDKWMWLVRGGPPQKPVVLFEYDGSRGEEVPVRLLEGFEGVLQADGYAGYNKVCRENHLTRIGCWDHARRKFVEASKAAPTKKKGSKVSKADVALGKIRKLYRIEGRIKDLTAQQKKERRQALSLPVLADLKQWLEQNRSTVPKDSLTYKAIQYSLNQWELLIGYCEDGQLMISNALAENAIRPFAVGRRNWLFADTPRGARASATVYSLIETARANALEPFAWLRHILQHIADATTEEDIEALLPWNVKPHELQVG